MKNIIHIIRKEFQQFRRDPKMFGIILIAPVIQLIFLGYAVNMDVENVKTVVLDYDRSSTSREFLEEFASSKYFEIVEYVDNYKNLQAMIEDGEALVGLVLPADFEYNINRNETAEMQAIFDGSDGNKGAIAAGYLVGVTGTYSKKIAAKLSDTRGAKVNFNPTIQAEVRAWYNPLLKTRNFMIPGIFGLLLSIITLILTSLAIVKEKEIGTLEQIIVTPIKPGELIMGKLIPFAILSFVVILIVLTVMILIFNLPVRGSMALLFFSSFLYILSTLGFGILVSTISKTQQQAMMIAIFVILMPMVFLSGFTFPIENMPQVIQWTTYLIPLKYFMIAIRGIILKGIGLNELWDELLVMFGMGVLVLGLSSLRFQKRLE
ncbi:MAG: ABC transporter permease [bacterium]